MRLGFLLVLASLNVHANVHANAWDDPSKPFSARKNERESMLITWKVADNVQATCAKLHKQKGSELTYRVDACSHWNFTTRTCTIITRKNPTMHDVGHEIRHCYQGHWH